VSSAGCHVNRLHALTALHFNDCLLTLDLTDTAQFAGFAASVGVSCHGARFTVQGVKGRTGGLGLLGNKLSIDLLTGIFHTLVIGGYKSVVDLSDVCCVVRCGENTALLNTRPTALVRYSLIFITFRAVCVANNGFAGNDVQLGDGIHFGATVTLLAGPRFKRLYGFSGWCYCCS